MVGSVGVAMFHPEAVRYASYVSHASGRRGTGMGLFAVGGTAGWALGPLLLTGAVLAVGLRGTALVALLPRSPRRCWSSTTATWSGSARTPSPRRTRPPRAEPLGRVRPRRRRGSTRTGLQFGLQAFVPLYIWHVLETSEGVGNASASVLMVFGAAGTLIGGRLADRIGFRPSSSARSLPWCRWCSPSRSRRWPGVFALMAMIGFAMEMNFYPLVVIAQTALPRHVGFASGVILGLSIGAGAALTALLGVVADAKGLEVGDPGGGGARTDRVPAGLRAAADHDHLTRPWYSFQTNDAPCRQLPRRLRRRRRRRRVRRPVHAPPAARGSA